MFQNWKLIQNNERVVIFNKAGRLINSQSYKIFSETISCTSSYKYIGLIFSASCTFSPAKKQFYDKSVKALYSLQRNIISLNPSIHTSLQITYI